MRLLLAICAALAGAPALCAEERLVVGVRSDATSMAFQVRSGQISGGGAVAGPLANDGFSGYVAFICDRALIEMKLHYGRSLQVEVVPVKAFEIWDKLANSEVDIVCGPTTATRDRLDGHISSPPVFISGVTYATNGTVERQKCKPIVGLLKSSTAGSGVVSKILETGAWPKERDMLAGYISNSSWSDGDQNCPETSPPIAEFETHRELAAALCKGDIKHYLGDYEIVAQTLSAQKDGDPNCAYSLSPDTFSEERYVILGRARSDKAGQNPLVAHYFEILSRQIFFQPSVLDEAFEATFPLAEPSRKLNLLYWGLRGNTVKSDRF